MRYPDRTRRQLLAAGLATAAAMPVGIRQTQNIDTLAEHWKVQLTNLLNQPENAVLFGKEFWRQNRHFRGITANQLLQQILHRIGILPKNASLAALTVSPDQLPSLRKLLDTTVRNEFADKETINLNGWIVSKTELSICTLAAMTGYDNWESKN